MSQRLNDVRLALSVSKPKLSNSIFFFGVIQFSSFHRLSSPLSKAKLLAINFGKSPGKNSTLLPRLPENNIFVKCRHAPENEASELLPNHPDYFFSEEKYKIRRSEDMLVLIRNVILLEQEKGLYHFADPVFSGSSLQLSREQSHFKQSLHYYLRMRTKFLVSWIWMEKVILKYSRTRNNISQMKNSAVSSEELLNIKSLFIGCCKNEPHIHH